MDFLKANLEKLLALRAEIEEKQAELADLQRDWESTARMIQLQISESQIEPNTAEHPNRTEVNAA